MSEFQKNLENSFDELGVSYDEVTLQKCLDICKKYEVTEAEEFVDAWMAYTVSRLQGENPTIANLGKFEREEFAKKAREVKPFSDVHKKSLTIYEANKQMEIDDVAASLMMVYNETTPGRRYLKANATPEGSGIKRGRNYDSSPQAHFSPASFSPTIASPSSNYLSRKNSGSVVCKFNDTETSRSWKAEDDYVANVELISKSNIERFMYFDLLDYSDYANAAIEKLGGMICAKHSLEEVVPVRHKHPTPFVTLGRIACDADGRLNSKSVLLEGSTDVNKGESVYLDLSVLEKYSIFPGQIVVVEGHNLTGDKLIVKEMHSDVVPEPPKARDLPRGSVNVTIAAGPFTPSDSLTYQPLLDLMKEVAKDEPHALILTGPLIDSSHPVVLENTLAETFEDFFSKLIDKIMKPLEKKKTQVIIINSCKDCNADYVYPTPRLTLKTRSYPRLHFFPDPSVFSVEDVVFGATSTDVLLHLSKEEICSSFGSGRLPRLASHILGQRSFYPLSPATEVPLDPTLIEHVKLDVSPHVLVLPSDLRYFITEIGGSVVINPERLAKGVIGGTFARMIINPNEIVANIFKI